MKPRRIRTPTQYNNTCTKMTSIAIRIYTEILRRQRYNCNQHRQYLIIQTVIQPKVHGAILIVHNHRTINKWESHTVLNPNLSIK